MHKKELSDFYLENIGTVYKYLLSMSHHREVAEDLTQETFARATMYLDKLDKESILGWLLRTARNLYIDRWRKERYQLSLEFIPTDSHSLADRINQSTHPLPEEHLLRKEQQKDIRKVLAMLPENYRTALVMRDILGLPYSEIQTVTNWSDSKVKVTIYQARKRFRKLYERHNL